MTDWTPDPPTTQGWYWLRIHAGRPVVVEVYPEDGIYSTGGEDFPLGETLGWLWHPTPLTPPQ